MRNCLTKEPEEVIIILSMVTEVVHLKDMTVYIESVFSDVPYDDVLLQFERELLAEWEETRARVTKAGLADENVLFDLFLSNHPDLHGEYAAYRKNEQKKRREKRRHGFLIKATPVWYLLMVAVYLGVSFLTRSWRESWLIIIGFVTVWVDTVGLLMVCEIASKRRLFHPIARILLALSVMMTTTLVYLIGLMLFAIPRFWVVFPAGVFLMYCADAVFARLTGQKLRVINYLIYVPAAAPMIYVVLAGLYLIPWHPGWLIVPLSVVVDILIIVGKGIENGKYRYRPGEEDA